MKPMPPRELYGIYEGDRVMIVGVPDDIDDLDAECIIEYPTPTIAAAQGTRKTVRWGDVDLLK